jgi:hypothetical protein
MIQRVAMEIDLLYMISTQETYLVGEGRAQALHHGTRSEVLGGDELQRVVLTGLLLQGRNMSRQRGNSSSSFCGEMRSLPAQ